MHHEVRRGESANSLLAYRFRRGVKILRDPYLLLRFLRIRLVSQRQPVFAAFLLDRKQRLIHFSELARGMNAESTSTPERSRGTCWHAAPSKFCVYEAIPSETTRPPRMTSKTPPRETRA
jgi:DNA repair protein RadC